uniref:3'-5' exonuclease domain-containing protein n=1 Tax=Boodleopsis pusilla TaxID=381415 RepID=A0A386AZE6_9CHLO|nr:hypothetical protein [Boodleopsis pusilla]AYC64818.1 hypothetical protein [Boodleopsis pusilla]
MKIYWFVRSCLKVLKKTRLHIQNFITRHIIFCEESWVPLGAPEDSHTESSLYGGYLKYTQEQGVKLVDILSYGTFRQEFLPLLNRLRPHWKVFERRRLHSRKKVFGILNIQITTYISEDSEISLVNLDSFRAAPFWVRSDQAVDRPRTGRGQAADRLRTGRGQATDRPRPGCDQAALQNIQSLLMNVPNASEEPEVLIQPELGVVQNLFQTNPVIALDTEFVKDQLAYIGFLHSNKVCIFTHNAGFAGFSETFLNWLKGNVAIIGFFMIVDLTMLWRQFQASGPSSEILLYKVFDIYLFFKLVHNGFKNQNSLAHWANRICKIHLDKSFQQTNWFTTPLDKNITEYLKGDVWVPTPPLCARYSVFVLL